MISKTKANGALGSVLDIIDLSVYNTQLVYVIILEYYRRNTKNPKSIKKYIPYDGKMSSKAGGISYRVKKLPQDLQNMIVNLFTLDLTLSTINDRPTK